MAVGLEDGALRWRVDLVEKLQARAPYWGFTTSPVIVDDVLVVQVGAPDGKALAAFDKRSGAIRWARGNGSVDYRSPVLATLHGRRQLLVSTSEGTSGVDPATGETLWTIELGSSNSGTPLAIGADRVLIPDRSGAIVIQVPADGEKPKIAWQSDELRGNYAAPVFYEGHLYGFTGRYLTCVDAKTGVRRWRSRQPGGKGPRDRAPAVARTPVGSGERRVRGRRERGRRPLAVDREALRRDPEHIGCARRVVCAADQPPPRAARRGGDRQRGAA